MALLERRVVRERQARLEAEAIAEHTTRGLYEANEGLRESQRELAGASALVALLERAAVAANDASALEEAVSTVLREVSRCTRPLEHGRGSGNDPVEIDDTQSEYRHIVSPARSSHRTEASRGVKRRDV